MARAGGGMAALPQATALPEATALP